MKRLRLFLVCAAILLVSVGCAGSGSPAAVRKSGVLRVAVSDNFAPFVFTESDGVCRGIDVEIAQGIADYMGVKCETTVYSFQDVFTCVKNGDADIGIAGITITASRMNDYTFSIPYFTTGLGVLAPDGAKGTAATADLVNNRVAVQIGTMAHDYILGLGSSNFIPTLNESEALELLLNGEVDYALVDEITGTGYAKRHAGKISILSGHLSEYNYGIIMKLGNEAMASEVNNALNEMKENGEYDRIIAKFID